MKFLYAIFFGAGVAAIAYNTFGRRVGYTNSQNIVIFLAVIFIFATIVSYSVFALVL